MTQTEDKPQGLVIVLRTTPKLTLKGLVGKGYSTPRQLEPWMERKAVDHAVRITRDDQAGRWAIRIVGDVTKSQEACAQAVRNIVEDVETAVGEVRPLGVFWFGSNDLKSMDLEPYGYENGVKAIGDGSTIAKIFNKNGFLSAGVTGPFEGPGALVFHADAILHDLAGVGVIAQ